MTQAEKAARDAKREYQRAWRKANPDKVKAHQLKYWAKRAAAETDGATGAQEKCSGAN